jgi:hypothetical protein
MNRKLFYLVIPIGIGLSIIVVCLVTAGTPIDGGNSFDEATPVDTGVEYTGVVSSTDTSDYYSLTVQPGQIVTVYYTTTNINGTVWYYLYDQNRTELFWDYASSPKSNHVTYMGNNSTPTRYFFVVEQYLGTVTYYAFLIKVADQTDVGAVRDAGDSPATATVLTPTIGVPIDSDGNRIGGADVDDYFRVNALPGQVITVTVTPQEWNVAPGSVYLRMRLFNQSLAKLGGDFVEYPEQVSIQVKWISNQTTPSIYYVHVDSMSSTDEANSIIVYNLRIEISRQDDVGSGNDAGDDYGTATVITPTIGSTLVYTNNILGCSDVDDFYRINVQPGQIITAIVTPLVYEGESTYLILGADLDDQDRNNLLTESRTKPSVEPMVLAWMSNSSLPSAYFLRVRDRSYAAPPYSFRYKIQVELGRQSDGGIDGDAGDDFDSARVLTPNIEWDRNLLGGSDTSDYFLVQSEHPYVGFSLTPISWPPSGYAGSRLKIRFYDIGRNQIGTTYYIYRPSITPITVMMPTSYYVRVDSRDTGSYQIQYKIRAVVFNVYLPLCLRY